MDLSDEHLRWVLTIAIAELGHAPSEAELATRAGMSAKDVQRGLVRLAEGHALLLLPDSTRPWVVHPFALAAGSCWVQTNRLGYWATCLYCAFGIAAALRCDAVISTRLGGESEPVRYEVKDGAVTPVDHVFHLSVPPARWWDNVIYACSSFQPFRAADEIELWCARHDLARGATMSIPKLWDLAKDWYGDYLETPWRKRAPGDSEAIFARHGLTGPFWPAS